MVKGALAQNLKHLQNSIWPPEGLKMAKTGSGKGANFSLLDAAIIEFQDYRNKLRLSWAKLS